MEAEEIHLRSADDRFQVLRALLTNRSKRHRSRQFLVQGVRPVSAALRTGWPLAAVVARDSDRLSRWASGVLETAAAPVHYRMTDRLMSELSEKEEPAEVILVARIPERSLDDVTPDPLGVICVLDRVASPGNLGTVIRSADAFGVTAVVPAGHSADPYDPACVRATTGSIFTVPVIPASSMSEVVAWLRRTSSLVRIIGADERARPLGLGDLDPPVAVVLGAEARGLSRAAVEACDDLVSIPMSGGATSLNLGVAAGIFLYEARRHE